MDLEEIFRTASSEGNLGLVNAILAIGGIDINAGKADCGDTALMLASEHGHDSVCKLLLECEGISVDAQNKHHFTALALAAGVGKTSTIALLLAHGADVNCDSGRALMMAIWEGQKAAARILLSAPEADLSLKPIGYTFLSECARVKPMCDNNGYFINHARWESVKEIAWMLIERGADLNVKDQFGDTAMHLASSSGNSGICRLLLEQGFDVMSVKRVKFQKSVR